MHQPTNRGLLFIGFAILVPLSMGSSAIATNALHQTVNKEVVAKTVAQVKFVTVPVDQTTSATTWVDVPGTKTRISLRQPSVILSTFSAESACTASYWCGMRIVIDHVGEMAPAPIDPEFFAFDTAYGGGAEAREAHAMQRSSDVLLRGAYTVRPQWRVQGSGRFWLGQIHHTVEAVQS